MVVTKTFHNYFWWSILEAIASQNINFMVADIYMYIGILPTTPSIVVNVMPEQLIVALFP